MSLFGMHHSSSASSPPGNRGFPNPALRREAFRKYERLWDIDAAMRNRERMLEFYHSHYPAKPEKVRRENTRTEQELAPSFMPFLVFGLPIFAVPKEAKVIAHKEEVNFYAEHYPTPPEALRASWDEEKAHLLHELEALVSQLKPLLGFFQGELENLERRGKRVLSWLNVVIAGSALAGLALGITGALKQGGSALFYELGTITGLTWALVTCCFKSIERAILEQRLNSIRNFLGKHFPSAGFTPGRTCTRQKPASLP